MPLVAAGSVGAGGSERGGYGGASCFGALLLGLSGPELTRPTLKLGLLLADELGRRHHRRLQELSHDLASLLLPQSPSAPSGTDDELGEEPGRSWGLVG